MQLDRFGVRVGLTGYMRSEHLGGTRHVVLRFDVKDHRYFIMMSFRRHIFPPSVILKHSIFMPPDRMIGGILFLSSLSVCLSVCLFVCLSVNFNLRYNF